VAGDDDSKPGGLRLQIKLRQIVQHVDGNAGEFDHLSIRQLACPTLFVNIPANGSDGCNRGQLLQNFGRPDIARVDDMFGPAECAHSLGPQQPMRVGDDANVSDGTQFSVPSSQYSVPGCPRDPPNRLLSTRY
jgi:hypothetical protein